MGISIQHLFGFDEYKPFKDIKENVFQYNTCLGSTGLSIYGVFNFVLFQYNTCLGSTSSFFNVYLLDSTFQYNTCLGSTHMDKV